MKVGCPACLDDDHDDCNSKDCRCLLETNNGRIAYDSSIEAGKITFITKHSDNQRIDFIAAGLINRYNFVTAIESDTIYLFTGKIYENEKAIATIKEQTEKRIVECTERDCLEVIAKIKRKTYKNLKDFDKSPNFINTENGILNLDTMELKQHTHTYLSKVLLPVKFRMPTSQDIEKNLEKTLFWKFLKSSFTVDEKTNQEDMKTVLEIMASVFLKTNVDERSVMFLGGGENGKSVCLDYIKFLLGKKNFSNIPLQIITNDRFSTANLDGKLANIFTDLEKDELKHTGTFKAVSSGEAVYAQKKYGQPFDLIPVATQIFSTNRFPKSYDQSQGFFRRWIIVQWLRNFENDPDRDGKLKEKLLENESDRDIVFSNLIQIARNLLRTNEFTYSKDWQIIKKEWNANADPVEDFMDNYIIDSDRSKTKRETYQFYKKIMVEKGEIPLGIGKFGKIFSEYFDDSKTDGTRTWLNIDFKEPKQETLQEYDNA